MYAETPRRLMLVGDLNNDEISNLIAYCHRLHGTGQTDLHLDMTGVIDCHRAGLDGLLDLVRGSSSLAVTVGGARWGQFMEVLSHAPIDDVQRLCDDVRGLIGHRDT